MATNADLLSSQRTEIWVVFIVACVPPIRKLLVGIVNKVGSTIGSKGGTKDHSAIEFRSSGTRTHRPPTTMYHQESSNESDGNILGEDANVWKTTNINIEYWRREEPVEKVEHHDRIEWMELRSRAL